MPSRIKQPSRYNALRRDVVGIAVAVVGVGAFAIVSAYLLSVARDNYVGMNASQWVLSGSDKPGQGAKAQEPYDLADQGVYIPPAREERSLVTQQKDGEYGSVAGSRDCYEKPEYIEASDLCAQWASAAAMRVGNGIAAESYRLNYIVGFISALGVLLAGIGVILAAIASKAAIRGVEMMAYGFMPVLNVSVRHHRDGYVRLTIKNVGTGPALGVAVESNGQKVDLAHERFAVDTAETVELRVDGANLLVRGTWRDLADEANVTLRSFVKVGQKWVLAEDQPSDGN